MITAKTSLEEQATEEILSLPRKLEAGFSGKTGNFLPYKWQLTTEISYLSDEHFLESFYRDEYNLG